MQEKFDVKLNLKVCMEAPVPFFHVKQSDLGNIKRLTKCMQKVCVLAQSPSLSKVFEYVRSKNDATTKKPVESLWYKLDFFIICQTRPSQVGLRRFSTAMGLTCEKKLYFVLRNIRLKILQPDICIEVKSHTRQLKETFHCKLASRSLLYITLSLCLS